MDYLRKAGNSTTWGKLPGFTKTVKVLPLSFTASVAMVPPSRFDDF